MRKTKSIDDYLATVTETQRASLAALRKTIRSLLPAAEECISYSLPAFRYQGEVVAGFSATKQGCSYYPFSGTTLRSLAGAVAKYSQTPGALHFAAERGLPVALVRKLLKARVAELPIKRAKQRAAPSASQPSPRQVTAGASAKATRATSPTTKRRLRASALRTKS